MKPFVFPVLPPVSLFVLALASAGALAFGLSLSFAPRAAQAQEAASLEVSAFEAMMRGELAYAPLPASAIAMEPLLYRFRPIVVFADSPYDPQFIRQMAFFARDYGALIERDAVLITDTAPQEGSPWRQRLRPNGFALVVMDKDIRPEIRKPFPWELREITHAIDKFPLRRQEMLERSPSGR